MLFNWKYRLKKYLRKFLEIEQDTAYVSNYVCGLKYNIQGLQKRVLSAENDILNTNSLFSSQISNLSSMGMDVNFNGQSTIIIVSKIDGGQVRIIDTHFKSGKELKETTKYIEESYGSRAILDTPNNKLFGRDGELRGNW